MGTRSSLWRKWNLSSFDSVAVNIRTGTLTSPKEIVPLQIDRGMGRGVPGFQSSRTRQHTGSKTDACRSKGFSTQRGGRLFGPDSRPEVVYGAACGAFVRIGGSASDPSE